MENYVNESTHDSDISFQRPGGPFRIESTYSETADERYDTVQEKVFENGNLVKEFKYSALDDLVSSSTYEFIANELTTRYPQFLDRDSLERAREPFEREVRIGEIARNFQEQLSDWQHYIGPQETILSKYGFEKLPNLERTDPEQSRSKIAEEYTKKYLLKREYHLLNDLKENYQTKTQIYEELKSEFLKQDQPSIFNYFKRQEYNQIKESLAQKEQYLTAMKSEINNLDQTITSEIVKNSHSIEMTVSQIESAAQAVRDSREAIDHLSTLRDNTRFLERLAGPESTITVLGDYQRQDMDQSLALHETVQERLRLEDIRYIEDSISPADLRTVDFQHPVLPNQKEIDVDIPNKRQEKIRDFIPDKSRQGLPSQEYLRQAKSLHAKGHTPEKADEIIAKSMLSKGFSNKAVAQALAKNSPQFDVKEGQLAAKALVRDVARTPEVKRAKSMAQDLSH